MTRGFTLLELLIVIGIIAILGIASVLLLNPAELFSQSRDSVRIAENKQLDSAVALYRTSAQANLGNLNTIYISLPDTSSTCANLLNTLPTLPSGWSYHCASSENYRRIDGTGWLPLDFTATSLIPFSTLPIDSVNTTTNNLYYSYINNGEHWVITSKLQSAKYLKENAWPDGGDDSTRFETGTDANLWSQASGLIGYWKYNANALDASGNNINGTLVPPSGGVYSDTGKSNQGYHFVGTGGHINFGSPAIAQLTGPITIMTWANLDVDPPLVERYIFDKSSVTSKGWGLSIQPGPFARFRISSDGTNNITATTGAIPITQWIHIAGVYEPNTAIRVYVNGVLSANNTTAIPASQFNNVASNLIAGYEPGCGSCYYYRGISDEVRLYNRAVTATEIQALYEAEK